MHPRKFGAGNETRTRDLYLGKVSLYQLSYSRRREGAHYIEKDFCVNKDAKKIHSFANKFSPMYNARPIRIV